ncbi:MAG: alpha/beta fold hydrolase, partial [Chitinophagales bacterium]
MFSLENGTSLSNISIAYHTYGQLNRKKNNVIWVCHAFTGSADVADWWSGLLKQGGAFDPEHYFIVCANVLGSCYGTTGPTSINPETGQAYFGDFPLVTIRDIVHAHILLRKHLGIDQIHIVTGGSMGGQQAVEWAIMEKEVIRNAFLVACNDRHSPWGIAYNESQRMA